jgi:hypothetical protein
VPEPGNVRTPLGDDFRQRVQLLRALVHAAERRGLTAEEERALAELREAVRRLLDETSDTPS